MIINWFPGHMKKTKDMITQHIKLVDVVVELLDARMPVSSRNPIFDELVGSKPRIIALNKADLADPTCLKEWQAYFQSKGTPAVAIDALHGKGIKQLMAGVTEAASERIEKFKRQNRHNFVIRMMIVGIPNVGKSSLINALAGKKAAVTGNRPGVTKGKQWIKIRDDIELFDTPGILWPKIESDRVGLNLAYTGSIKDDVLPIDEIALYFLRDVIPMYPTLFEERYKCDVTGIEPLEAMENIARKRGCILSKNEVDYNRVAHLILDEFRRGMIGQMTIEKPSDLNQA